MAQSDLIAARKAQYLKVFTASDAFGRVISVMRLRPSQQPHVRELCPGLSGVDTVTVIDRETGQPKQREMSRNFLMLVAASVRQIDDTPYTFPKTRADLDFMLDTLDDEGLAAAVEAWGNAYVDAAERDVEGEAKNAAKTPV